MFHYTKVSQSYRIYCIQLSYILNLNRQTIDLPTKELFLLETLYAGNCVIKPLMPLSKTIQSNQTHCTVFGFTGIFCNRCTSSTVKQKWPQEMERDIVSSHYRTGWQAKLTQNVLRCVYRGNWVLRSASRVIGVTTQTRGQYAGHVLTRERQVIHRLDDTRQ